MAAKAPGSPASSRRPRATIEARILETALDLAEESGWDNLRLSTVADRLGISLADLLPHYRDLDGVADAWFAKAWQAMLATTPEGFAALPARARLFILMMRWFDALAPRRAVTAQMIRAKLYPSHPHHWVPMIFNLSRTIQWLRDAAHLDAGGRRRQLEEVGLSALFLATLRVWMSDESPDQARTRTYLERRLARADRVMARLWRPRRTDDQQSSGRRPASP